MKPYKSEFSLTIKSLCLTIQSVAQILGIHEQTVYSYVSNRTKPKPYIYEFLWMYSKTIDQCAQKLTNQTINLGYIPHYKDFASAYPELVPLNDEVQRVIITRAMSRLTQYYPIKLNVDARVNN